MAFTTMFGKTEYSDFRNSSKKQVFDGCITNLAIKTNPESYFCMFNCMWAH